ncbi:hypothetical protein [Streptomyces europaeiscabiei]|uniref:hypothetical protein n=1 Tax=Streptomyces europaeiscabiei TaxID=146819 RepID=UPI002E2D6F54|nr:hypothetical protein [Streptomyces europaeiscabiei]
MYGAAQTTVHMYGVVNTAAKVSDYLNLFVAAELPIVEGEFGHNHSESNPRGRHTKSWRNRTMHWSITDVPVSGDARTRPI